MSAFLRGRRDTGTTHQSIVTMKAHSNHSVLPESFVGMQCVCLNVFVCGVERAYRLGKEYCFGLFIKGLRRVTWHDFEATVLCRPTWDGFGLTEGRELILTVTKGFRVIGVRDLWWTSLWFTCNRYQTAYWIRLFLYLYLCFYCNLRKKYSLLF